ncbi:MAG: UDP-N-acetylmuramoyl-L-alanyl-D-glutamate--2,6-diaminopimelate ligase [bacterium]|nr:UDP-N-acetylmuramoyl-L-alanyl-D-glutamate--2,6-diaminopimelate ligase [bacterium]
MKELIKRILPSFLLGWYHLLLAFLAAFWYRFPSSQLILIGVTGTNGKSTTAEMIFHILSEAGCKTALLSSIHFQIGDKEERNTLKMTMPGRFFIQGFLRKAVDQGCRYVVLEVTSEGILQHRHRFLNFHTAVFTNISPEHIERHGSFENYMKAKGQLFEVAKNLHVVNGDDSRADFFLSFPSKERFVYTTGAFPIKASDGVHIVEARLGQENMESNFSVAGIMFHLQLLGKFQASNALAAICVALSEGISLEVCKKALEGIRSVPGRMEVISKEPFLVIVDYAFTPAALEQVYQTFSSSKLVCLLGAAGGGRDVWKRSELGKIAVSYCREVIITNEDPYEEDPRQIMEQVAQGAREQGKAVVEIVEDRREAIRRVLSLAHEGDAVIITGKGSEDSIAQKGGVKMPWDDREVVREELSTILDKGRIS